MALDPKERVALGRTGLQVTRLALGGASIGGLFSAVDDEAAIATVRHAWGLGIRTFDTAPLYGYGASERRIGQALKDLPRDAFVLSTKVGRLVHHDSTIAAGLDVDRQRLGDQDDAYYARAEPLRIIFDYSADGVRRSLEASLERLGLDRVDIALIHDPDDHWREAIEGAWPALARLRSEGVVRAIGAGMNQSEMLTRFARETDMDVLLLANRYTLLDQGALATLLPACIERGVAILLGGVMNTGILADPRPGSRFDYGPARDDLVARAQRLAGVCARYEVPLRAAAIQFSLAHPAVVSLVAGVRSIAHLDDYPAMMALPIPADLWAELRAERLIAPEAPVPA
jgi:D-threo-aldose 1-dehydrogenase